MQLHDASPVNGLDTINLETPAYPQTLHIVNLQIQFLKHWGALEDYRLYAKCNEQKTKWRIFELR